VATELAQHITHPEARASADRFYGSMKTLRSEDIANAVVYVLAQPQHVDANEILIKPTEQQRYNPPN
jgi:NADP-dependent 3-hydroxy acid dehydrogenase YdfG